MSIADGDYLKVSCNFELGDGTLYQNIYYYTRDGTDPFSDAAHIAAIKLLMEQAYAEIEDQVKDDVTSQLSFVDKIAWNGTEWAITENIGTFTPTFVPAVVTDALPFQCAPFVVFKTLRPRSVGKKFLFPFGESQQANSILIAGAVTAMVAYSVKILATINLGGDATLTCGIVRTGVEQWLSFLVAVVNDVIGTQRRRRPGVGA